MADQRLVLVGAISVEVRASVDGVMLGEVERFEVVVLILIVLEFGGAPV